MTKSKKKKLKRQNLLLGVIVVVFLIGITGYVVKAHCTIPGKTLWVDVDQEQVLRASHDVPPVAIPTRRSLPGRTNRNRRHQQLPIRKALFLTGTPPMKAWLGL